MEVSEDIDDEELEDDDEEEGSKSEEEYSDDSDRPRKHRPFVPPPPREALPVRTTRGKNLGAVAAVQDDQADEEFWNQEFFAEEEADEIYATESEPEDNFDADFMESEGEETDGEEAEEDAKAREPKKKTLRPPGYKRPPPGKKPATAAATEAGDDQEAGPSARKRARRTSSDAAAAAGVPAERTVGVRESTRQKVQEGEDERKAVEASKPRRASRPVVHRQLTQAELLAEAARTAIENTRSLQYLVMIEEETKKKANIKKRKYVGPMVRLHSAAVAIDDGEEKEEKTTIEVRNMQAPAYLQPQTAPAPPPRAVCVISGQPARYRDPSTGLAYADLAAFKELQARKEQQVAAQMQRQQAQSQYAAQQQQQQQQQLLLQQQAMMQQRQAAFHQQQFFAQQAAQAAGGGGAPNPFLQ